MLTTAIESGVSTPLVDIFKDVTPAGTAAYKLVVDGYIDPKVKNVPFNLVPLRKKLTLSLLLVANLKAGEKWIILIKAFVETEFVVATISSGVVVCFEQDHMNPPMLANIKTKNIFFFILLILIF
jgi:hypothetical protein